MKIIKDLGLQFPTANSKKKRRFYLCECPECKSHFKAQSANVKNGHTKSCGCLKNKIKHGDSRTRLYSIWLNFRHRCNNENHTKYEYYGGRNISYAKEWDDFVEFKKWAMSNGYTDNLEIDRIDNDKGYTPSNCRWTTRNVQTQNTRVIQSNNTSGYRGVTKRKSKWAAQITHNKALYLGVYDYPYTAAYVYDSYVIKNKTKHSMNFVQ